MIYSSIYSKTDVQKVRIEFIVIGTTPSEAFVESLDTETPGSVSLPITAHPVHPDTYILEDYINFSEFSVKLNSEPKIMEFESETQLENKTLRNLIIMKSGSSNLASLSCRLPFADISNARVTVLDADGRELEFKNNQMGINTWTRGIPYIANDYGKTLLQMNLSTTGQYRIKAMGGSWTDINNLPSCYMEVSGIQNVLQDPLIKIMYADDEMYSSTYGNFKSF